jgi:hypothetical protein
VLPLGGLVPLGSLFFLVSKGESVSEPARMESSPPMKATPPPAPPAKKQGNGHKHP